MKKKIASKASKENLDKRVLEKPFLAASTEKEELAAWLRSLPDLAGEATAMETAIEGVSVAEEIPGSC